MNSFVAGVAFDMLSVNVHNFNFALKIGSHDFGIVDFRLAINARANYVTGINLRAEIFVSSGHRR